MSKKLLAILFLSTTTTSGIFASSHNMHMLEVDLSAYEDAAAAVLKKIETMDLTWCSSVPLAEINSKSTYTNSSFNGELIDIELKNETKQFAVVRYADLSIKAVSELDHEMNMNGLMLSWYPSGEFLGCAELVDEKHEGASIAKFPNGQIKAYAEFSGGEQSGAELRFDTAGKLARYSNFKHGKQDGWGFFWSPSGKLVGVTEINQGQLITELYSEKPAIFEEMH